MRACLGARRAMGGLAVAVAMGLLAMSTALASSAHAATPGWKLLGVTSPTNLPPRQSEVQRVTVEAQAGTYTLSRVTGEGQGNLSYGEALGSYSSGASSITFFFKTAGTAFAVGQEITEGAGIAAGTTITSVSGDGLTIGLSQPTVGEGVFATVKAASKEVTGLTGVSGGFHAGDSISGPGIPGGTTITEASGSTLTLSAYPTQAGLITLQATETTGPIDFDAEPEELQAALEALPAHPAGSVTVTGGPGGDEDHPYFIEFGGTLADQNVTQFTATGSFPDPRERVVVTTTVPGGPGQGAIQIYLTNVGGAASNGTETLTVGPLPAGITVSGPPRGGEAGGSSAAVAGWSCPGVDAGAEQFTCSRTSPAEPLTETFALFVPVTVTIDSAAAASSTAPLKIPLKMEGGGASRVEEAEVEVTVSKEAAEPGIQALWAGAFDEEGNPAVQAGGHPHSAAASFVLNTRRLPTGQVKPAGDPHDVLVDLPPGFVGNPTVTPRCPNRTPFETGFECTSASRVGEAFVNGPNLPRSFVTSAIAPTGWAAQFSFIYLSNARISIGAHLRSDDDFGISILAPNIAQETTPVFRTTTILYGKPAGAEGKAFLTNPSDCAGQAQTPPVTMLSVDAWHQRGIFDKEPAQIPPVVGCDKLEFTPGFTFQPSTSEAATGTATTAHVHVDQARLLEPDKLAPPHLKDSVVTLPEGLTLNPAAANGLQACTTAQVGYKGDGFPMPNPMRFNKEPVKCPDASKIGTAEIKTPLLDKPLQGIVYLAAQDDNPFKSLLAMYIVIEDERTGIVVKLPGEVIPNEQTGQLKAVFQNNPQVPFEDLILRFRGGGPRSTLATPDVCGTYTTNGSWTPWSAPESGPPAATQNSFTIDSGPGGGACAASKAQRPFGLGFEAGTTDPKAGGHSPFTLRITRPDGAQELDKVTVTTPPGLVATLKGIPYCPEPALAAAQDPNRKGREEMANPSCPAASQVGTTTIGVGVGSEPLYVKTGKVYLTGPYKGAPVGLAFVVPAVAGPFDLGVQVVRTALRVNPRTAQVTAESDEIPKLLKGIPLLIRDVRVDLDRPGFVLNPTNCEPMTLGGQVSGASGAVADVSTRFQVGSCEALGFKPKMQLRLKGGTTRAKYQQLTATVWARPGDANIGRASVTFPRSIFLAQEHIRTVCTRVQFAADKCPKGSVYGQAEAITPLLDEPLKGPVYLRSSDNLLPDLVAALEGPAHQPIKVELVGRTDSKNRGLRNTFDIVPDAPVTKFTLRMQGGKKSLLVTSRNICKRTERATVKLNGQNGRRHNFRQPLTVVNCKKKAKRKASAKRRRG